VSATGVPVGPDGGDGVRYRGSGLARMVSADRGSGLARMVSADRGSGLARIGPKSRDRPRAP
jgi:hypothetical protein